MIKKLLYEYFSAQLIGWNSGTNSRIMPWKGEKDPYKIWLSEIILQQTRVGQGLEFYQKFIINFPSVIYLAQAPDVEIFKLWEGLGYYTRCKNLIATARYIAEEKALFEIINLAILLLASFSMEKSSSFLSSGLCL